MAWIHLKKLVNQYIGSCKILHPSGVQEVALGAISHVVSLV